MEYIEGIDLGDVWFNLEKDEIDSFMDKLAKFEFIMMSISFPAGGSIYYARDLKQLSGSEGIPLEGENQDISLDEQTKRIPAQKERFCVGSDVSVPLWYGRREEMGAFVGRTSPNLFYLFLINCCPRQRRRVGAGRWS